MTDKEELIKAQDKIIELQKKVIELTEQNRELREKLQDKKDVPPVYPYYPYPCWPITVDPKTPIDTIWSDHTTTTNKVVSKKVSINAYGEIVNKC